MIDLCQFKGDTAVADTDLCGAGVFDWGGGADVTKIG